MDVDGHRKYFHPKWALLNPDGASGGFQGWLGVGGVLPPNAEVSPPNNPPKTKLLHTQKRQAIAK